MNHPGRARTRLISPFVSSELPGFDLHRALEFGMLPPVVLSPEPLEELDSYVGTYLREEIQAEALSRNIEGFSRFLSRAAQWSGELLTFEGIGRDSQVPARTVSAGSPRRAGWGTSSSSRGSRSSKSCGPAASFPDESPAFH